MELPDFVPPMLAQRGTPFDSEEHVFEIKWDGIRALTFKDGGLRVLSRNRNELVDRFPEHRDALERLPSGCVLDGELVVLRDGHADFPAVLQRVQARGARRSLELAASMPTHYVVFDVLFEDFGRLTRKALKSRREILRDLLEPLADSNVVFSDGVTGAGKAAFDRAVEAGHEGVVGKRLSGRYVAGSRSDSWIKIKRSESAYCAIIGFLTDETGDLKSLIIATDVEGELTWVGNVGSGLDDALRERLHAELLSRIRPAPLVPCTAKGQWVEPDLMCSVSYHERTATGMLRAPVFKGLVSS